MVIEYLLSVFRDLSARLVETALQAVRRTSLARGPDPEMPLAGVPLKTVVAPRWKKAVDYLNRGIQKGLLLNRKILRGRGLHHLLPHYKRSLK